MCKNDKIEDINEILICRHLQTIDVKFLEIFSLDTSIYFYYVLNHIKEDIVSKRYNRNKNSITPE